MTLIFEECDPSEVPAGSRELRQIAEQLKRREKPEPQTVRTLLRWYGAQRRHHRIVQEIREDLEELELATEPDFEFAYLDGPVAFVAKAKEEPLEREAGEGGAAAPPSGDLGPSTGTVGVVDRSYRIGKLAAANLAATNKELVSVKPDAPVAEAVTAMLLHDFSQLPVMEGERSVKGVISWKSLGRRLALGLSCARVRDCMEQHHEISSDTSLFDAIPDIVRYEYVLITASNTDKRITGIVTTTDLSLQLRQLGEPFLLIGEIENYVRDIISAKFSLEELQAVRDPSDSNRTIQQVSDLTFGEYVRLLQEPTRWEKLGLRLDRATFVAALGQVRDIRNDVVHFDPDGIAESDCDLLRNFVLVVRGLKELGAV